jgi:hypothetical protein
MYVMRQFATVVVTPVIETVAVAVVTTPAAIVSQGFPEVTALVIVTI